MDFVKTLLSFYSVRNIKIVYRRVFIYYFFFYTRTALGLGRRKPKIVIKSDRMIYVRHIFWFFFTVHRCTKLQRDIIVCDRGGTWCFSSITHKTRAKLVTARWLISCVYVLHLHLGKYNKHIHTYIYILCHMRKQEVGIARAKS